MVGRKSMWKIAEDRVRERGDQGTKEQRNNGVSSGRQLDCQADGEVVRSVRKVGSMLHWMGRRGVSKWMMAVALTAVLVAGGLFLRSAGLTHAAAIDGCHSVQEASAKASGGGYTLTVSTFARVGDGNVYCGTMFA